MEGLYETTDLLSEHDKRDFLFRTLKGLPGVNDAWELSLSISTEITSIKNNYTDLQTLKPESCEKKTFLTVCKAYEKRKQALKKLDFDVSRSVRHTKKESRPSKSLILTTCS